MLPSTWNFLSISCAYFGLSSFIFFKPCNIFQFASKLFSPRAWRIDRRSFPLNRRSDCWDELVERTARRASRKRPSVCLVLGDLAMQARCGSVQWHRNHVILFWPWACAAVWICLCSSESQMVGWSQGTFAATFKTSSFFLCFSSLLVYSWVWRAESCSHRSCCVGHVSYKRWFIQRRFR